jgi:hypothetical protein
MPGLRWTTRGAVALPETLQIRLAPSFAGRVRAGAPLPGRSLSPSELEANLRWFTRTGPRGRPVQGLVLSGISDWGAEHGWATLAAAVREARQGSVRRVVGHVDGRDLQALLSSELLPQINQLAVAVRSPEEVPTALPGALDLVIPLEASVLPGLLDLTRAAMGASPHKLVFTWPFPGGLEAPPPAAQVADALVPAVGLLRSSAVPFGIKGLPVCALGGVLEDPAAHVSRSGNRWYVDAEHQLDRALLFLPDVLRFSKRESCRFCEACDRCDGVAEQWLLQGLVTELVPLRAARPEGVG